MTTVAVGTEKGASFLRRDPTDRTAGTSTDRTSRSEDGGDSWALAGEGWPTAPTYTGVLRGAMATDGAGTFVAGSTGGRLWLTDDTGETWRELPPTFPRIGAVEVLASERSTAVGTAP